ncbi:MAG: hypothetical protein CBC34_010615 [Hyphomicrobiaceae bacterium TMED74]|nr:hypothetical protein [Filomicrobium sp.]RPG41152.1 MAG: hypothetical protein CBC34_010615 [Hyphomicrobiaceae bacterium TMED74]
MHDSIVGERLGVPSVGVMTTEFISAAQLMSRVLGAEDFPFVVIDHPFSSATPEQLSERAQQTVSDAFKILTGK